MSGGAKSDRKSKSSSKTQGWEEAGAEFYQESYPGDLEGLQRSDPSKLATLLPSKQNRNGELDKLILIIIIVFNENHICRRQQQLVVNVHQVSTHTRKVRGDDRVIILRERVP